MGHYISTNEQNPLPSASFPRLFKGIALFTPGGGLVYCIDPNKQTHWHLHLCAVLRDRLGLAEPPHFLVPCYTATVDRWLDAANGQVKTVGEASPLILKHQALLNAVFGTGDLIWQKMPIGEGLCDPIVLATYRNQFPKLWEPHDLVVRYEQFEPDALHPLKPPTGPAQAQPSEKGYVLRLFVSGSSGATERILQTLYQLLEQSLCHPYTLKVIDVTKHPEQAEIDQVTATPTLMRVWPLPVRRVAGSLDNVDQLLRLLSRTEN